MGAPELLVSKHQKQIGDESTRGPFFKRRKRLSESLPSKEGKRPIALKVAKSTKAQRKREIERERRFREMEICLEAQQDIGDGRLPNCALGGISISEVLTALGKEEKGPVGSKTLPHF